MNCSEKIIGHGEKGMYGSGACDTHNKDREAIAIAIV